MSDALLCRDDGARRAGASIGELQRAYAGDCALKPLEKNKENISCKNISLGQGVAAPAAALPARDGLTTLEALMLDRHREFRFRRPQTLTAVANVDFKGLNSRQWSRV